MNAEGLAVLTRFQPWIPRLRPVLLQADAATRFDPLAASVLVVQCTRHLEIQTYGLMRLIAPKLARWDAARVLAACEIRRQADMEC